MATFCERLKHLQEEQGRLKKDVSAAVGLSLMGYYRYEQGTREPSMSTLIALAQYFDVSVDYLLGLSDVKERR